MMKMYLHFGFGDQFLFEHFVIDSTIKMFSVCGVLFLLTILYESIKYVRCVSCGCQAAKTHCATDNGDIQDNETNVRLARNCYVGRLRTRRHKLIQTLLHTAQTSLGFLLMLSIMSFNLCIIFAVVLGKLEFQNYANDASCRPTRSTRVSMQDDVYSISQINP